MGRRNVKGTKGGKFMNPTDQARKEARKKELKKNKKQRLLVRTSVLKNKDPGMLIRELEKLDEIEYNPTEAPQLVDKVLKEKRKKLRETLDRVLKLYQKENPTYYNDLQRLESEYERRRFHRIQYFEAVKQAESVSNVEEIPLPDMPAPPPGEGGMGMSIADIPLPDGLGTSLSSPAVIMALPVPRGGEVQGILKKAPMLAIAPGTPTFEGRDPPGVPLGPPPDLSEMDDLSDDEIEFEPLEQPKLVDNKTKGVRFSDTTKDGDDKTMNEMDRFMKEVEEECKTTGEEDLQPPGFEGSHYPGSSSDPSIHRPEESLENQNDVNMEERVAAQSVTSKPETAADVASALAAATSGRPPIMPPPSYYPPPPNRIQFRGPPPPIPHMMRGGFPPGSRPPGSFVPSPGGPGLRIRQPQRFVSDTQANKSDNKVVSGPMIQAKPQIRSLSADVTRFVPTAVKSKKEDHDRPKRPEYQIGQSQMHFKEPQAMKPPQQSKDDAYADFMKEMQGLM